MQHTSKSESVNCKSKWKQIKRSAINAHGYSKTDKEIKKNQQCNVDKSKEEFCINARIHLNDSVPAEVKDFIKSMTLKDNCESLSDKKFLAVPLKRYKRLTKG